MKTKIYKIKILKFKINYWAIHQNLVKLKMQLITINK